MATSKSEVFLEIGECKDKDSGAWGQLYLGGKNGSKYKMAGGSSKQGDSEFLYRLEGYNRNFYRAVGADGSKVAGRPDALPMTVHFECNHVPVFNLIQAFFGDKVDNLVNFHVHVFREFTSGTGRSKRARGIHIKTISGWAGRIVSCAHMVGGDRDEMSLILAADRWKESIWESAVSGGKKHVDFSHAGEAEDIDRAMPMS